MRKTTVVAALVSTLFLAAGAAKSCDQPDGRDTGVRACKTDKGMKPCPR